MPELLSPTSLRWFLLSLLVPWCNAGCAPPAAAPPAACPAADTSVGEAGIDPQGQLAWALVRGSIDPAQETFYYWSGVVLAQDPQSSRQGRGWPVFLFEGYNVARVIEEGDRFRMVSREVAFYEDLKGEIIDCWAGTPESLDARPASPVSVVHVWNDPVNHDLGMPPVQRLGDQYVWAVVVDVAYPSPLPKSLYPQFAADDVYRSTEAFHFYAKAKDLRPGVKSVPALLSWTRVGPYLPWMQLGARPGQLIYSATGRKIGGWDDLPEKVRREVMARKPEYRHAPPPDDRRANETTWSGFRKLVDSGQYQPNCTMKSP